MIHQFTGSTQQEKPASVCLNGRLSQIITIDGAYALHIRRDEESNIVVYGLSECEIQKLSQLFLQEVAISIGAHP